MIVKLRRRILDRFVLRPSRNQLDFGQKQRYWFESNENRDEYFVSDPSPAQTPDLLIIKFPGTAGRAERATDWPGNVLPHVHVRSCTWNAPGYGGSTGKASLSRIAQRAEAFFLHLADQVNTERTAIWLTGNSLGCATATYLTSKYGDRIDGLVLRNPPPLIETVKRVADRYPLGRWAYAIADSLPESMNLLHTAPNVITPVVMLQSELDELVPLALQDEVFELLSSPKHRVVMKGIGHAGLINDDHLPSISESIRWLWDQSAKA
ncbi:alpha/beta fold hydrolase [Rhodopirellula sp. MGV]|uniref:alpha/beta fold hydrolase n=1 Tax=Rhodopirellula sp. MGV TaxID=2023130 RepID=UPI000B962F28|nr:alpha/beta fold hydrolase [Rhodopirellula sp. MGV]OYP36339.1 hypothetical protein CGZ80_08465 [Rhodopirellula sp. MGV]PNY38426.1 alpha/beta hydrolase [Rhodopirellula baltica]